VSVQNAAQNFVREVLRVSCCIITDVAHDTARRASWMTLPGSDSHRFITRKRFEHIPSTTFHWETRRLHVGGVHSYVIASPATRSSTSALCASIHFDYWQKSCKVTHDISRLILWSTVVTICTTYFNVKNSWLRHYATSRKVAGSFSDEVIGLFNRPNLSSRTMALGSTQPLTEMNTKNLPGGKGWPAGAWGWQPHRHCLENVGASTSHNPMSLHGLLQG
jgi:hypothetical protein